MVRGLVGKSQASLYAGQSVNYDEVYDFDGYIWIAWTVNSGARVYMPIGYSPVMDNVRATHGATLVNSENLILSNVDWTT